MFYESYHIIRSPRSKRCKSAWMVGLHPHQIIRGYIAPRKHGKGLKIAPNPSHCRCKHCHMQAKSMHCIHLYTQLSEQAHTYWLRYCSSRQIFPFFSPVTRHGQQAKFHFRSSVRILTIWSTIRWQDNSPDTLRWKNQHFDKLLSLRNRLHKNIFQQRSYRAPHTH